VFTGISTAFNWFVMRKGALSVGRGEASIWSDLARMPLLVYQFVRAGLRIVTEGVSNRKRRKCSKLHGTATGL
jgi:hypothetical protein